ncbi:hypothetical protein NM688_g5300 [Phlebia brevispora]|uniref:Uncharacterized protein n=1 Tax=Phlebia brevispora TaxID=194682 RepID=A0ACC1SXE0_9APHY|nr:hypothetical protein NM688_g5300 [Phlebia brevispora]
MARLNTTTEDGQAPVAREPGVSVGSMFQKLSTRLRPRTSLDVRGFAGRAHYPYPYAPRDAYYVKDDMMYLKSTGEVKRLPAMDRSHQDLLAWSTWLHQHYEPFLRGAAPEPPNTAGYYSVSLMDAHAILERRGGSYNYLRHLRDTGVFWPTRQGKFCPRISIEDEEWQTIGPPPVKDPRTETRIANMFSQYIDQSMFDEDDPMTGGCGTAAQDLDARELPAKRKATFELYAQSKTEETEPALRIRWT